MIDLKALVRTVPDFPKPGIQFRDLTTLLSDGPGYRELIARMAARCASLHVTKVAGIEARGFILGGGLAVQLGAGFIPIRKRGKLPFDTIGHDYQLEYGVDRVEIHRDAVAPGERIVLIDDLIATGGTALAGLSLLRGLGAVVPEACFAIELPELGGRVQLEAAGCPVYAEMTFEGH
jgi:adenine phosphoribosyltransferase